MNKFICQCGRKVNQVIYKQGQKYCQFCNPANLSGQFERKLNSERQKYEKDLIQPKDKENFIKLYGQKNYNKAKKGS